MNVEIGKCVNGTSGRLGRLGRIKHRSLSEVEGSHFPISKFVFTFPLSI